MAWLYKQVRSKNWFIGWRVGKKLFNRSTGTPDRKQAEKALGTFSLLAETNHQKRLTEDFFYSLIGKEPPRTPLLAAVAVYLDSTKGRTAAGTFVRYKQVLDSFCEHLHAEDSSPLITDISGEVVQQFLNTIRSTTSTRTANFYLSSLKAFFNQAVANGKISTSPMKNVGSYKTTKTEMETRRRPFAPEELRAIYIAAPDAFWRFAIVFGLYTGLRLGNVVTLRWQDVDLKQQTVSVVDIKAPEPLIIPLASRFLLNTLAELRQQSPKANAADYVFPDRAKRYLAKSKNGENNASALSVEFRGILVKAGLAERYKHEDQGTGARCRRSVSPLSFHSLRHNFITMLKERGAPQMVAQRLVGHDSAAVNALYTHASAELIRNELKKLPEVFA